LSAIIYNERSNVMGVIDCCGLSCPEPVLKTRKALQETGADTITVKVDTVTAKDNVTRAAKSMGWQVQIKEEEDGLFILTLTH
jgi:tRNA 2-thiouridine synthesizing protein A